MQLPTGRLRPRASLGFTLVELLLVVSLMLVLLGAIVFNFDSMQRGAALEEGTTQFEALIHFARAQAALTGRRVEVSIQPSSTNVISSPGVLDGGIPMVRWEPDPLARPGYFERMLEAQTLVDALVDHVQVLEVHPWQPGTAGLESMGASTLSLTNGGSAGVFQGGAPSTGSTSMSGEDSATAMRWGVPVRFYPDGSSDSVEFVLRSTDVEDSKRIAVRLEGITGVMQRRQLRQESNLLESANPGRELSETTTQATEIVR